MHQELEELIERWPLGALFDLPANSIVAVVGAYKGVTMELIEELYHPKWIYGFEPQDWAAQIASDRLRDRLNCQVYNCALGTNEGIVNMGEFHTDAASLINVGDTAREHAHVQMYPAELYFDNIPHVDLMVMNIEGSEYTLLPHMRNKEILKKVDRLAVQWHLDIGPGTSEQDMDLGIQNLIILDELFLRHDDRPAWSYHTKAMT